MAAARVVMPLSPGCGVPAKPAASGLTASGLDVLREQIRSIERRPTLLASGPGSQARLDDASSPGDDETVSTKAARSAVSGIGAWTLGDASLDGATLDRAIGLGGLEIGAVHEIKPVASTGWAAGFASAYHFALALAVRRLIVAPPADRSAPILVCFTTTQVAEMGSPYAPGLAALGLPPGRLILVEAAKQADVLWAVDEGLKSEGLALVLGQTDDVDLTPARRLALAAARTSTPCLLLTHPRSAAAAATATRWRIAPAPSAPHPLDPEAPGEARFLAGLERCRGSPAAVHPVSHLLEWCNAAYRFRVVAGLVDGASRTRTQEDWPARAVGGRERP